MVAGRTLSSAVNGRDLTGGENVRPPLRKQFDRNLEARLAFAGNDQVVTERLGSSQQSAARVPRVLTSIKC